MGRQIAEDENTGVIEHQIDEGEAPKLEKELGELLHRDDRQHDQTALEHVHGSDPYPGCPQRQVDEQGEHAREDEVSEFIAVRYAGEEAEERRCQAQIRHEDDQDQDEDEQGGQVFH